MVRVELENGNAAQANNYYKEAAQKYWAEGKEYLTGVKAVVTLRQRFQ